MRRSRPGVGRPPGTARSTWPGRLAVWCAILPAAVSVAAGVVRIPPGSHTVLTRSAPRDTPVAGLGLREAGLQASTHFPAADEIRVFGDEAATNASPLARIWINASQTNAYWFHTGGQGSAEHFTIRRGHAVIVVTRPTSPERAVAPP